MCIHVVNYNKCIFNKKIKVANLSWRLRHGGLILFFLRSVIHEFFLCFSFKSLRI